MSDASAETVVLPVIAGEVAGENQPITPAAVKAAASKYGWLAGKVIAIAAAVAGGGYKGIEWVDAKIAVAQAAGDEAKARIQKIEQETALRVQKWDMELAQIRKQVDATAAESAQTVKALQSLQVTVAETNAILREWRRDTKALSRGD